ncbi:MAG: hypothetical protein GY807_05690 [Gammaproteobacteria bacterium]|nr:hypothetical protein [Gammaproteobacteria bacterium]
MNLKTIMPFFLFAFIMIFANCAVAKSPSPGGVELYFIMPQDGDAVKSPLTVCLV